MSSFRFARWRFVAVGFQVGMGEGVAERFEVALFHLTFYRFFPSFHPISSPSSSNFVLLTFTVLFLIDTADAIAIS